MDRIGNRRDTQPLLLEVAASDLGARVVRAAGELDVVTGPVLREFVSAVLADDERPVPDLVLDLRGVSFLDSIGLGVIARVFREARTVGTRLKIECAAGPVSRLMDSTGLSTVIATLVTDAVESATPSNA